MTTVQKTYVNIFDDVLHQYLPEHESKEKKPNVIWEYLKALHNKTCPLVEYTDDKDD